MSSSKSLTVIADHKKKTITSNAPTVAAVLKQADVTLDSDDEVKPGKDAFVTPDDKLRVVRIKKVTKTETVPVGFKTTVRQDPDASVGEKNVVQPGKKGKAREKVTLIYADGKLRERVVLVSRSLAEPRPQIEEHGTSHDAARQRLGQDRQVRVRRQLVDQHRQRLLRRPAVQRRDVAQRRWHGPAERSQPRGADQARQDPPGPFGLGPVGLRPCEVRLTHSADPRLLGPADVRRLAESCGIRPTKQRGQNFVIDANTVRRIVRTSGVGADDVVVEIGPGLGSLTLGLLEVASHVTAVELDEVLAAQLPSTIAEYAPDQASHFDLVTADAMQVTELPGPTPTALVANLPYNVSVPVLLTFFERFPTITTGLVMVQAEVAHRLAAGPGSKTYGVPSVKAAWYAELRLAGSIGRNVFWPMPNVESALVAWTRREPPGDEAQRLRTFAVVDAAFAQRRKTMRAALSELAGSGPAAEEALVAAGISPQARGEQLGVEEFFRLGQFLTPA